MKKIYTLAVSMLIVCMAGAQSQRLILAEEFTQASCGPCAAQNPAFNTLLAANTTKAVSIKYQTNWPGIDPMNAQTQTWVGPRVSYYNVSGVPHANMDGTPLTGSSYTGAPANWTQTAIDNRYAVTSPFTVAVTHSFNAGFDSVFITATITASQNFTSVGTLKGHVAMVEQAINFSAPPGTNGETDFYGVCRQMYPNASGTTLPSTWVNGNSQTITIATAVPGYIYDKNEIAIICFVQDDGNQNVEQAGISMPIIIPNDAAATALTNVPLYQCATNFTPSVTIKNTGGATLTSCTLNWQVDAGSPSTQAWTGSIAPGGTAAVALSAITATAGAHTLDAWTTLPNGSADVNSGSDHTISSFAIIGAAVAAPLIEGYTATTFPPAGWFIDNQSGDAPTWTRNGTAGGFGNSVGCAKMDFYNAPAGSVDIFYAQNVNMTAAGTTDLTFSVAYCQYSTENDNLTIEVSTDCGATWTSVYSKSGSVLSTKAAQTAVFTPTAAQWRAETVSLSSYASATNLMIRFNATSDYGNNLYIDDINIGTVGIEEAASTSSLQVFPNPSTVSATVNFTLEKSAEVTVNIYNALGELVSSENRGQLAAGAQTALINTASMANGLYAVEIVADNAKSKTTLVVNH